MVFCLQMGSSKEKWEKKVQGQGETLPLPNLRTSPQLEGPMAWDGARCRVGNGQSWGLAESSSESPFSTLEGLRVGCIYGRGLPAGGGEAWDHRPQ